MSLLLGWFTLLLIGTDLFVVSPLLPQIANGLGISAGDAGLMVTVFALAYVVGGPRLGAVADKRDRRQVLAASLVVFAGANVLTGVSHDFVWLLIARALAGFGASGVTPTVYAMVVGSAPEGKQATWLSVVTSGLLLALCSGAPAGSIAAQLIGWRGVFYIIGGMALAVLLAALATTSHYVRNVVATQGLEQAPVRVTTAVKARAVSTTTLWALAVYGVYTYLGVELRQNARFTPSLVAAGLVIYGVGALAGNLVGGPLADRKGPRSVVTLSLAFLAFALVLLGAVSSVRLALLVGLGAFSFCAYPYFSAHQKRLVARFGPHSGALLAWNNTAMYLGVLVGSALGGRIIASAGFPALTASAAVVAAIAAFSTRKAITDEGAPEQLAEPTSRTSSSPQSGTDYR